MPNASVPQLCGRGTGASDPQIGAAGVTHAPHGFVDGSGWARSRSGRALGLEDACGVLPRSHATLPHADGPSETQEESCGHGTPHRPCTSCHARLAHVWTRNSQKFFHWIVEVLPRVAVVLGAAASEPPVQLLLSCRSPVARSSLELLGIAAGRVVCRRDKVSYATSHELLWPPPAPCGGAREAALRALRAALLPAFRPAVSGRGGAVLLHQRREPTRRLTNHVAVVAALRAQLNTPRSGVRVFVGTAPLREQVQAFRAARCQVGPHGAGMSLMVFAPADFGTAEVTPARYFVRLPGKPGLHLNRNRNRSGAIASEPNACYRGLAAGLGQRHEWLLMPEATANSDMTPVIAEVVVVAKMACGG